MIRRATPAPRARAERALPLALLIALPFLAYANGYRHAFQLDDNYTVLTNTSVRHLTEIPRYFIDPGTLTSVREQADYRPILSATYAINYAIGGYTMWGWHLVQIILHVLVTLGVFALCRRVLELSGGPPGHSIPFAAAALFAVHPGASGVVNYINARSSLLTAAFLLPALISYMAPIERRTYKKPQWATAAFYSLALFTKVEAVGALGALWAFELWQRIRLDEDGILKTVVSTFDKRTLTRLAPALVVTAVYFLIRWKVMAPYPFEDARHSADVGAYEYFVTQLTAWWYYVLRWIAPVRLVADYLSYPVFRSWTDPFVLLAIGGWIAIGTLLLAARRSYPHLLFLAIAALALLSPTSSIAPLAEMVNEHRPYLPMGILSLAFVIPIGTQLTVWPRVAARNVLVGAFGVILVAFSALTWRRNDVFTTDATYWKDVLAKAPSARAHLNYGLAMVKVGNLDAALRHYRESLDLAPFWYYNHINLGAVYQYLGQADSARKHFDLAVGNDLYSGQALSWRGEFQLSQRQYGLARQDFLRSLPLSLQPYRNAKGLAIASAGLGDALAAYGYVQRMRALDSVSTEKDLVAISLPFLQGGRMSAAGLEFQRLIGQRSAQSMASAEQALMTRGLDLLRTGDLTAAATTFRQVIALNPSHYGAHHQLAVALDRTHQTREARAMWQQVLRMAQQYNDTSTQQTARARLQRNP